MVILSDYEEEDNKKSTPSAAAQRRVFNAALIPSDSLGFLEKFFEIVAGESDLFKTDFLLDDVNAVVRMVRDKVETGDKKRKDVKIEGNGETAKKIKEEVVAAPVKLEEAKKAPVKKEEVESAGEEGRGQGGPLLLITSARQIQSKSVFPVTIAMRTFGFNLLRDGGRRRKGGW